MFRLRATVAVAAAGILATSGSLFVIDNARAATAECSPGENDSYNCNIWLPSDENRVPVYASPGSSQEVDHLHRKGANAFVCKVSGPTSTDYGYSSSSWAKTTGDDGKEGWTPANYFASKASEWTGLPDCSGDQAPADPPSDPGPDEPAGPLDGPATAKLLLGRWGKQLKGNDTVRQDLQVAAQGGTITNSDSCGKSITLDPRMLELLRQTTDEWNLTLSNIVTGHGCDTARHPKGKAFDVAAMSKGGRSSNQMDGTAGNDPALNGEFASWQAHHLPGDNLSGVGQLGCSGRAKIDAPAGVNTFADSCNHQHVQVGESDMPLPHKSKGSEKKDDKKSKEDDWKGTGGTEPEKPTADDKQTQQDKEKRKQNASPAYQALTQEQIDNSRTIIAVGKGAGLPKKALIVAIATARQESTLYNLNHGDRDSLGLFQQRPSAGWGSPAQITDPVLSAKAFYGFGDHASPPGLAQTTGWENMSVSQAAQAVQVSAFPDAYAQWEGLAKEIVALNDDVKPIK